MNLRFERAALDDLDDIFSFVAANNQQAAAHLVRTIEELTKLIAAHPYIGAPTSKAAFRHFRIGRYLIVYEVGKKEIVILYVRHAARSRPWEGEE